MQVSTNDLYETNVLAKSQINLQSLLRDANSSKSRRVADVSNVVSGRRLVYCAAVASLLLSCRAKLIKASKIFPRAGRAKPLLMGHPYPSPICINSHAAPKANVIKCMCQPMTSVGQAFSSQFAPLQKVRSMSAASAQHWCFWQNVFWQIPQTTLCQEDFRLVMLPCDVFQESCC